MSVALGALTWMFLAGLAGSSIVAVLFIVELVRVTLTRDAAQESHKPVEG